MATAKMNARVANILTWNCYLAQIAIQAVQAVVILHRWVVIHVLLDINLIAIEPNVLLMNMFLMTSLNG